MEISTIGDLITQIGFPIAVCLICFWYINKIQTQHKEEMTTLKEALDNNTSVLQKLVDKLDS